MSRRAAEPAESSTDSRWFDWIAVAVVILVAFGAAIAGLRNAFTQDDIAILRDSARLQDFSSWREILTLPYWPPPASPDLYRPIVSFMLVLESVIGDGAPIAFRIGSIILYAAASLGVYRLARRLCTRSVALGVATLFAAHPVHVESVALAVAQNELLVALLATVMVAHYLDRRRSTDGRLRPIDWAVIGGCYLIAGFAKEQGLLLPLLLILADALLVRESDSTRVRVGDLWKGYLSLAVIGALMVGARTAVLGGRLSASITADALRGLGIGRRALTMLQIVPQWFRLLAWPAHLRAEYSPAELVASRTFGAPEALGLLLLIGLIALAWLARRRAPAVAFGIGWMAVALLPVSNVIVPTGILLAERTLFLPSVGFVIVLGGAVAYLIERTPIGLANGRRALAGAAALLVALGVLRSAMRDRVWRDPDSLTLASVDDAPRSWRVQQAYGDLLFDRGEPGDAVTAYGKAIAAAPETWRPRNRLAMRLRMLGDDSIALVELRLSLAENPGRIETMVQIPATLIALGHYAEAKRLADSIVVAEDAPPVMVQLAHIADSAIAVKAPAGTIRIGVPR